MVNSSRSVAASEAGFYCSIRRRLQSAIFLPLGAAWRAAARRSVAPRAMDAGRLACRGAPDAIDAAVTAPLTCQAGKSDSRCAPELARCLALNQTEEEHDAPATGIPASPLGVRSRAPLRRPFSPHLPAGRRRGRPA